MNITLIVAMDSNRGIGFQNTIPWMGKITADMEHFRKKTTGHPVIMGRNTYLSIGRALPNRANIVLSNLLSFMTTDAQIVHSFPEALELAMTKPGSEKIFVIGGAQVYNVALPYANQVIITFVDGQFEADTYFPKINMNEWSTESEEHTQVDEKNLFPLRFLTLKRKTAF